MCLKIVLAFLANTSHCKLITMWINNMLFFPSSKSLIKMKFKKKGKWLEIRKYFLTWNLYLWTLKGIIKAWPLNQFEKDFYKRHASCEMENLLVAARDGGRRYNSKPLSSRVENIFPHWLQLIAMLPWFHFCLRLGNNWVKSTFSMLSFPTPH